MSRVRGVFPLFLVTAFGIANGVWVFGPAFKEQQEKERQAKEALDVQHEPEESKVDVLRKAEAHASQSALAESAPKTHATQKSWWTSMGLPASGNMLLKTENPTAESAPAAKVNGNREREPSAST